MYKQTKKTGISEKQAEAIAEAIQTNAVSKEDLLELKMELKNEISDIKSQVMVLTWMMGFILAGIASLVIKTFFA